MSLRIDHPGLCASVQDRGRRGHSASGVGPAGAADSLSLRLGNRLIGNDECQAAIEMTLTGATITIQRDAVVCLAGSDAPEANITGEHPARPLESWTPIPVRAGSSINIGPLRTGCRTVLCIDGGIATEPIMGSRSVHLPTGIGGRSLRAGDVLPLGEPRRGMQVARPATDFIEQIRTHLSRHTLRIVPSAQHERFSDTARREIGEIEYTISERSDRTGVRFEGKAIESPRDSMRSEGVVTGALQIPPGGHPIGLLVDRPATGGYPVLGCIIGADLAALGQLRPRDRVRFEWVSRQTALELLREQEELIARLLPPAPAAHARRIER